MRNNAAILWVLSACLSGCGDASTPDAHAVLEDENNQIDAQGAARGALAVSATHTCEIRGDETLWCWGKNSDGQLGLGDEIERTSPTHVVPGSRWRSISTNATHTCGVRTDGSLWCWGLNQSGSLGVKDTWKKTAPNRVDPTKDWWSVSVGARHSCGIRSERDGETSLWCWGDNEFGQLGIGSAANQSSPRLVSWGSWKSLSLGEIHSCALAKDDDDDQGQLWCWGANYFGQLGLGEEQEDTAVIRRPRRVPGNQLWTSVSAGNYHTCALNEEGEAYCWGDNVADQLSGSDSGEKKVTPTRAGNLILKTLSAGLFHTCGIDLKGQGWCWGSDAALMFGQGSDATSSLIRLGSEAENASPWKFLVAGEQRTCGKRKGANAQVACWEAKEEP